MSESMSARSSAAGSAPAAPRSWLAPSSTASTSTGRAAARRQASIARLRTMLASHALTPAVPGR